MLEDGSTIDVHVEPMTAPPTDHRFEARTTPVGARNRRTPRARAVAGDDRRIVRAARLGIGGGCDRRRGCDQDRTRSATSGGRSPERNGGSIRTGRGRSASATTPAPGAWSVSAVTGRGGTRPLRGGRSTTPTAEVVVAASDAAGFRHGFVTHRPTAARRVAEARADRRRPDVRVARAPRRSRPPVLPGIRRRADHRSGGVAQARSAPPPPHRRRGVAGPDRRLPRVDHASAPGAATGCRSRRCSARPPRPPVGATRSTRSADGSSALASSAS